MVPVCLPLSHAACFIIQFEVESKSESDSVVHSESWQPRRSVVVPFPEEHVDLALNIKTLMQEVRSNRCCLSFPKS